MPPVRIKRVMIIEIILRIFLWTLFLWLENLEPFIRVIQEEELWLYKYPITTSYVPGALLWVFVFLLPTLAILYVYMLNRNDLELRETLLCLSLNYGLVGVAIQYFKIIVGRPRPDFFYRCFPDGKGNDFENCTGDRKNYMDGRKSFPSGHSGFAFASMLFLFLYLAGKLKVFTDVGRGVTWRLCLSIAPLAIASSIAISRTCDYHHHWQDVVVGSLLGSIISYVCYRQYFPSLYSAYSDTPYALHCSTIQET